MFDEEYIYLTGLTHNTALIAWGKFFFEDSGKVLDRGAMEPIGENSFVFSQPFAEINIRDAATDEALPPIIAKRYLTARFSASRSLSKHIID